MRSLLLFLFLMACSGYTQAQNAVPLVRNVTVEVNPDQRQVTWSFDLQDAEEAEVEVWVQISADSGKTFQPLTENLSGDVGPDVSVGPNKQITWSYPDTLADRDSTSFFVARILADDGFEIDIQDLVDQVNSARLWADLQWLEGIRHSTAGLDHLQAVQDSLENRFLRYGLQARRHPFSVGSYAAANIIGDQPGQRENWNVYIVDAHFDTVSDSPGADDNGSGVVGVLEAGRILSGYDFGKSLRFIGFDQEEVGLLGSIRYVTEEIPEKEQIEGVLNLEMIGYYCEEILCQSIPVGFDLLFPEAIAALTEIQFRGIFLSNVANAASSGLGQLFDTAAATYVPELMVIPLVVPGNGELAPDLQRSDHSPFWFADWPALMLTDGSEFRNPNYHEPTDTIESLDTIFLTQVVKAVVATLAEGAQPLHVGKGTSPSFQLANLTSVAEPPARVGPIRIFPNPAREQISVRLSLAARSQVRLEVFDAYGRRIHTLGTYDWSSGDHQLEWTPEGRMEAGMYVVRIQSLSPGRKPEFQEKKFIWLQEHRH